MGFLFPGKFWSKFFFLQGAFVALVLATALRAESPWVVRDSGVTANLWSVSNADGPMVVVVGEVGTILTSSDAGVTWVHRESGTTAWLTAVVYDSTSKRFFAVGEGGLILSSADGITWVSEASPTTVRLNAVTAGGGIVSAVGESGAGYVVRDSNGIWTRNDVGFGDRWLRGLAAPYAVGQGGAIFQKPAATSSNNTTPWQAVLSPTISDLESAVSGHSGEVSSGIDTVYLAVGANGTILRSDGTAFIGQTSGTTQRLHGICYKLGSNLTISTVIVHISIGEYFVVGDSGTILRSSGGVTWQSDQSPTSRNLKAVTALSKTVVAVGDGGTIIQTGGDQSAPTISQQPITGIDATGQVYAEGASAGQGALTYLWVEGGNLALVGRNYPRQLLTLAPFPTTGQLFQLIVGNAFGVTRSPVFTPNRFIDLASRAVVGAGENILISGFAVSDVTSRSTSTHRLLVRGVGPGLSAFGVTDALKAPRLSIFSGSQLIATSTNWELNNNAADIRAAAQSAGAFPLASGSADAALLLSLAPGNYTAQVSSADGSIGTALVEVYEVDPLEERRLSNLSARAQVQSGTGALIGGLVIDGGAKKAVLLRASGPALTTFGLQNVLTKPKLTLYRGNNVIATAADWSTATNSSFLRAAAKAAGAFAFPEGSADAALLLQLDPGAYTLQVSGADGGNGVALVEVYESDASLVH